MGSAPPRQLHDGGPRGPNAVGRPRWVQQARTRGGWRAPCCHNLRLRSLRAFIFPNPFLLMREGERKFESVQVDM